MLATFALAGELAALATAVLWACSALAWSLAGRKVGSVAVAVIRVTVAALILAAAHWVTAGRPFPAGLPSRAFWLLVVSGGLGVGLGDLCVFRGLLLVGPRLAVTILSLAPFLAAGIAYLTPMRETLGLWALLGMVLTVGGVTAVVSEPRGRRAWTSEPRHFGQGVLVSLVGTCFLAVSMVLAKMAMRGSPAGAAGDAVVAVGGFQATVVRVWTGMVVCWLVAAGLGRAPAVVHSCRHRRAMLIIVAGTVVGPVVGIWLSMEAIARTAETGVAMALIATSPIFLIPLAYAAYGERPSLRTIVGTIAAVGGVAVLVLRHTRP